MKKAFLIILVALSLVITMTGCNQRRTSFEFEVLNDLSLIVGSSYLMDFGTTMSQEESAILEGKLLTAFGTPAERSDNYENAFTYVIRATAKDGRSVVLCVYFKGIVQINALQKDTFAEEAANALIDYVNAFKPTDFEHTVYYLDFMTQLDIQVKDGKVTIGQSPISEEKADELFNKWYP